MKLVEPITEAQGATILRLCYPNWENKKKRKKKSNTLDIMIKDYKRKTCLLIDMV